MKGESLNKYFISLWELSRNLHKFDTKDRAIFDPEVRNRFIDGIFDQKIKERVKLRCPETS